MLSVLKYNKIAREIPHIPFDPHLSCPKVYADRPGSRRKMALWPSMAEHAWFGRPKTAAKAPLR